MRRIVNAVILGMLVGLDATQPLAASPQVTKPPEQNCLITLSATSKSVFCSGVLARLAAQASAGVNSNRLPYDEFGLAANQPSQPRIGPSVTLTGPAVTGLGTDRSAGADRNRLPYDEFGLAANPPSQPQIGDVGN